VNKTSIFRGIEALRRIFTPQIIIESNYAVSRAEISWYGYESGFVSDLLYAEEHARLLRNRQYSLLLYDSSFIQFYYGFNNAGELTSSRLAYYPSPIRVKDDLLKEYFDRLEDTGETLVDDYYQRMHEHLDQGGVVTNSSHIRIDYDPTANGHSVCHLQLGSISNLRIASDALMTPFAFWHWIIHGAGTQKFHAIAAQQNYKSEFAYQSKIKKSCVVQDFIYLTVV
jgi:hypothetical protein